MAKKEKKGILANWESTGDEIRQAMDHAIADALRTHQQAGNSVVFWDREHDRIMIVPPEEIVVPDGPSEEIGPVGAGNGAHGKDALPAASHSGFSQQSDKN